MGTFAIELPTRPGLDPKDPSRAYEPPTSYQGNVRRWCEAAYEEAKLDQGQQEESQYISKYIDYIIGKQWPGQRPSFRASPVDNRIWGLFWELVATLTDIRPVFAVKATSGDSKPLEHASDIITKAVRSWWMEADADMSLALAIIYGLLTTGYGKLTWNEELRNGFGDFELLPLGPSEVLPLKPRMDLDSSQAVIYQTPQPLGWFKRFGAAGTMVKPDPAYSRFQASPTRPGHMPNLAFDMLSPQMKRMIGGPQKFGQSAYPAALYREFWLKDYCVSPSTRILTSNLEWKRADSLNVGDELVGCDEEGIVSKTSEATKEVKCRWLRRTTVESIKSLRQPCVRITTDKGPVTCSTLHRWLVKTTCSGNRTNRRWWIHYEWKHAKDINPGDSIAFLCAPWEEDQSRDAGYLAGIFDGEGWATKYSLGFGQKEGIVLHKAVGLLEERGYKTYLNRSGNSSALSVVVNGGRESRLRFLGTIRPSRLLSQSAKVWEGKLIQGRSVQPASVLSVEEVGEQEVLGIQTTERTFIAEGFISHNSVNTSNGNVVMADPTKNWSYVVKPNDRLYPRGRLICMGGDVILHDGPNPYWHGMFPFVDFRMNIVPWQYMGLSEIRPMIPLQDIINNVFAGVLDMIKKAVNPVFMAPKQAASESLWSTLDWGMPGAKFAYNANTPGKPEFGPAPQLPAFVLQFANIASREMDRSSGISAVSQAVQKKQVPSGDSLDQIQRIQQTPLRLKGRNIEIALRGLGRRSIWNAFQFYTQERMMYMYGKSAAEFSHFTWNPQAMIPPGETPFSFARNFSFLITPGSLLDLNKVERAFTVMRLRMMHDIDRKSMYRELDMGIDVDQVEQNLAEEAKQMQAQAQAAGGGMPQGKIPKKMGRM